MRKDYLAFFSIALIFGFILGGIVNLNAQEIKAKEKIKFLVISERKDIYFTMSQNERKQIEDASTNYLKQAIKAAAILEFYNIPGWNRAVSIEQYDSVEELYNHFDGDPIYPYVRFEVYPLNEIEMDDEIAAKAKPDSKKMKFLVINEAKDIYYSLPAGEREKIDEESPFQPGDLLKIYSIPGWNRMVAIEQYESIESLYNHFEKDSYYPYANFEVYPLIEVELTN